MRNLDAGAFGSEARRAWGLAPAVARDDVRGSYLANCAPTNPSEDARDARLAEDPDLGGVLRFLVWAAGAAAPAGEEAL